MRERHRKSSVVTCESWERRTAEELWKGRNKLAWLAILNMVRPGCSSSYSPCDWFEWFAKDAKRGYAMICEGPFGFSICN